MVNYVNRNREQCWNFFTTPIKSYHTLLKKTFSTLPEQGKLKAIVQRIVVAIAAPILYPVLSLFAVVGIILYYGDLAKNRQIIFERSPDQNAIRVQEQQRRLDQERQEHQRRLDQEDQEHQRRFEQEKQLLQSRIDQKLRELDAKHAPSEQRLAEVKAQLQRQRVLQS